MAEGRRWTAASPRGAAGLGVADEGRRALAAVLRLENRARVLPESQVCWLEERSQGPYKCKHRARANLGQRAVSAGALEGAVY